MILKKDILSCSLSELYSEMESIGEKISEENKFMNGYIQKEFMNLLI